MITLIFLSSCFNPSCILPFSNFFSCWHADRITQERKKDRDINLLNVSTDKIIAQQYREENVWYYYLDEIKTLDSFVIQELQAFLVGADHITQRDLDAFGSAGLVSI